MVKTGTETEEIDFSQYDTVEVNQMLRYLDAVSEARKLREGAEKDTDTASSKNRLIERLEAVSKVKGENVTRDDIELGIAMADNKKSYCFKEPARDFGYLLTGAYVTRKKWGIPTLLGALALVVAVGSGYFIDYMNKLRLEKATENAIVETYQKKADLKNKLGFLSNSIDSVYEKSDLQRDVTSASDLLDKSDDFFIRYCPNGDPSRKVSLGNLKEVQGNLVPASQSVDNAGALISDGQSIVSKNKNLRAIVQTLEARILEIRNITGLPASLLTQAEQAYKNAVICVNKRDLVCAQQYQSNLESIKSDGQELSVLPSQLESEYNSTLGIAASDDDSAKILADRIKHDANIAISNLNIIQAKEAISEYDAMQARLAQDFVIRIHNQDGDYTFEVRPWLEKCKPKDDCSQVPEFEGKRYPGYVVRDSLPYFYVEAVGNDGNYISQRITDQENQNTKDATIWSEQVTWDALRRLESDKKPDGIVNDNIFARKGKGYWSPKVVYKGMNGRRYGQILTVNLR